MKGKLFVTALLLAGAQTVMGQHINDTVWTYNKDSLLDGPCTVYDSTGAVRKVFNFKNDMLNGRQVDYLNGKVYCEEYFEDDLCIQDISYDIVTGDTSRILTLIDRQDTTFTATLTQYYTEEQDEKYGKASVDYIFSFDPNIWEYAFQFNYLWTADWGAEYDGEPIKVPHGKSLAYDRQNRLVEEGQYDNGTKTGIWKHYRYDLNIWWTSDYDNPDNPNRYYTMDGKDYTGQFVEYNKEDNTKLIATVKDGKLDGEYTEELYDKYGEYFANITVGQYADGKRTGHWKECFKSDMEEGDYVDGKREGDWNLRRTYCVDDSTDYWDAQLKAIEPYHNGKLNGRLVVFKDKDAGPFTDSIDFIVSITDDLRNGPYERHGDDGRIVTKGSYSNDERVGEWYFEDIRQGVRQVVDYSADVPDRFYTLDGKPYTGEFYSYSGEEVDDTEADVAVLTIKKSLIQLVQYANSHTGEIFQTVKYKDGVKVE